jgi:pyrroloquinoline quinone (PQQ) biosynthesis protein C
MTSNLEKVRLEWTKEVALLSSLPWQKRINSGEIELCHYKGILLETYHNAGQNPQLQAYSTFFLKNNPRNIIKKYYQHAISEISHDLMAKADLMALGVPEEVVVNSKPLPENLALQGCFVYLIQHQSALAYLGYLFHLEFLPTTHGMKHIEMLKAKGVPDSALTFLEEHATVDVQHNKMMDSYLTELIKNDDDLKIVIDATKIAARLHTLMIGAACERGEQIF